MAVKTHSITEIHAHSIFIGIVTIYDHSLRWNTRIAFLFSG